MTSIRDVLEAFAPPPKRGKCKFGGILDELRDDPEYDLLDKAVSAGRQYPGSSLAKVFEELGHPVSASLINNHRAGICACTHG